jgi:hypothetical protein
MDKKIYEFVQATPARDYWQKKHDLPDAVFEDVNWRAIQEAQQSSSLSTTTFVTKHSVGMCRVGKFMVRWKQRDSSACPRWGLFEDDQHVWKCHGKNADLMWQASLSSLQSWMDSQNTDPDLS